MLVSKYRLHDITNRIDRDKSTIIRWEQEGLIPKARRDSRGWRYYTAEEAKKIISLVKETNYFQQSRAAKVDVTGQSLGKISYSLVFAGAIFIIYSLFSLGLGNGGKVLAFTNQTSTMYTTVSAGILDIVESSSSNSFSGVTVLFTAQTSTASDMGAFRVSDARGSGAGWVVNLAGNDWKADTVNVELDYDSTGSDANGGKYFGKMCLIADNGTIASIAGQDTTSVTKGATDCFSASVTQIDIYTAASSFGKGDYWITDFSLGQFIPPNPTAQVYTTTIVLTIS